MIRVALLNFYALMAIIVGGFIGVGGAIFPCVLIWGPEILNTALGSPPDTSHPAFWLGLILLIPCLILGVASGIMLLALPVFFLNQATFTKMKIDQLDRLLESPIRWYANNLLKYADRLKQNNISNSQKNG